MHFERLIAQTFLIFAAVLVSFAAQAQAPMYGMNLNLDTARKVSAAAEAEARKNNWNVVIAVVDAGGALVMLQRIDGTQYGSVAVATQKAQSAVAYRRPTKVFEDAVKVGGNPQLAFLPGAMPVEGGLPILMDGKIVGAIGVSGVTSAQDGMVAKAGMESVK
ncbi:MAG: heme-binding protein [Rhodocyclales bacterium]|nr:heme-binding protein [Rhodocyclales bacterium]